MTEVRVAPEMSPAAKIHDFFNRELFSSFTFSAYTLFSMILEDLIMVLLSCS